MKTRLIIHQQICQLRWHLLACLGLLMVLPIEEAVVNLRAGGGFYSAEMVVAAVTFSPLLAGLLACAIVQGDLDEKRYIFWRSKPANVKLLMALKYFVGLVASLLVLACPLVFAVVTIVLFAKDRIERGLMYSVPFLVLIGLMTYSLCFACNVLVRKTARAWLIGMLLAGFLLVLPFILPLNCRDFVTDLVMWTPISYLVTVLVASVAAFVFALYAAQHDWHLRTGLKALLWIGAGLVFVLLMLLKSQVANIKVLDEKQIKSSSGCTLDNLQNRIILGGRSYVDVSKDSISLQRIAASPIHGNLGIDSAGRRIIYGPRVKGFSEDVYPRQGRGLYKSAGNDIYYFVMLGYYKKEGEGPYPKTTYEKVYLRSYKLTRESWMPADELDLSDCLASGTTSLRMAMRLIDNVIVACVDRNCIVVDVTEPGQLKRIDTKLDALKRPVYDQDRREEFAIPLVPVEGIGIEEKIRFSIDLNYKPYGVNNDIYKSSIVDIHDGKIAFFLVSVVSDSDIARFDVVRWDRENIYCRFSTARPFTIMESIGGLYFRDVFVKGGNLYCYGQDTLLVFDIRSGRRIRKLGHFVRMDYGIEDAAVLGDGDILLSVRWYNDLSQSYPSDNSKSYLYLLKNPS
jgi:hypothetical protein